MDVPNGSSWAWPTEWGGQEGLNKKLADWLSLTKQAELMLLNPTTSQEAGKDYPEGRAGAFCSSWKKRKQQGTQGPTAAFLRGDLMRHSVRCLALPTPTYKHSLYIYNRIWFRLNLSEIRIPSYDFAKRKQRRVASLRFSVIFSLKDTDGLKCSKITPCEIAGWYCLFHKFLYMLFCSYEVLLATFWILDSLQHPPFQKAHRSKFYKV